MELLQNTQTARLVLAYLYNQQLEPLAQQFCRKSPYLEEERRLLEIGDIPIRPFCRPLVQIFSEYNRMYMQLLTLIGQYEDKISFSDSLSELEKMDMILTLNESLGTSYIHKVTNFGAQLNHRPAANTNIQQVATAATDTIPSVPQPTARATNVLHSTVGGIEQILERVDSFTVRKFNLSEEEIIELLAGDRDKENDDAVAYLLEQGTETRSNCVNEATNKLPMLEKATPPADWAMTPSTQPPLSESRNLPSTKSSVTNTTSVPCSKQQQHLQTASTKSQQSQKGEELFIAPKPVDIVVTASLPSPQVAITIETSVFDKENEQTGSKEIAAARILGAMAKSGVKSGPANDTPPGNPIENDSGGGTRSTSSRKRSHIRILDFGTPATKRSFSVLGSGSSSGEHDVAAGSHSRKLFAGQGTPTNNDCSVQELQCAETIVSTGVTDAEKRLSGTALPILNPETQAGNAVEKRYNQFDANAQRVAACVMVEETKPGEIYTMLDETFKEKRLSSQPLNTRSGSLPEVLKQASNTNTAYVTGPALQSEPPPRVTTTAVKKATALKRTFSGTTVRIATKVDTQNQSPSPTKGMKCVEKEKVCNQSKVGLGDGRRTSSKQQLQQLAERTTRMVTRSSTKLTAGADSISAIARKISRLPTKDSIPKMVSEQPVTESTSYKNNRNNTTIETTLLHTEHLETPYKIDPLWDYPMTPRFLTESLLSQNKLNATAMTAANQREPPSAGRSGVDLNTPRFPITPGTLDTPKLQTSPHCTVSYYRPDEGVGIQPLDETPAAESATGQEPAASECATEDADKMEVVSGNLVFVISSTPLLELYAQEPTQR